MNASPRGLSRRLMLSRSAAVVGASSTGLLLPEIARAQGSKLRVGFMLPYTGTYAQLGVAIENGVRMAIAEKGGKLGGREIEWFKVDDESEPSKGVENAQKLVQRDKVDVLIGTVHSGVQMGIQKVARDTGVLSIIPNAGVLAATRALCAPNVFRTSFTNSQPTMGLGKPMMDKGLKKAVWITWKYAAGDEAFEGFKDSYTKAGGTIVKELGLPFPNVEFQALADRDRGAQTRRRGLLLCRRRCRQVHEGLRRRRPAGQDSPVGLGLPDRGRAGRRRPRRRRRDDHPALRRFAGHCRATSSSAPPTRKQFKLQPDVYAVQGYDTGQLLLQGLAAVKGDMSKQGRAVQGPGNRRHRQPARQVDHEPRPQPGAGHVPARGREGRQQGAGRGRQGAGRFGRRLPIRMTPPAGVSPL
jgi:branched-chain amino acid transport system substrate-binding protein